MRDSQNLILFQIVDCALDGVHVAAGSRAVFFVPPSNEHNVTTNTVRQPENWTTSPAVNHTDIHTH